jgi:Flp pilus assembly pilin Flp
MKTWESTSFNKANLVIEYAVLIVVIIAALLGISVYLKRAVSGRWRESADTFGHGRQYQYNETKALNP